MMSLDSLRRTALSLLILAAILALPRPLVAATLTVTDLGDSGMNGQLRTLINAAAVGDTIVIPAGTITLSGAADEDANASGDLDISFNLTIAGAGAGVTIIDGGGIDRVFDIDSGGQEVTISGLTIRNGNVSDSGGGISNASASTLSLTNVTVSGNTTAGDGGGITNGGTLTLTNSTVSGNTAESGGGITTFSGTITLTNSTVSGNTAGGGGGIFIGNPGGTITLTNSTVSGNMAGGGGGIEVASSSSGTITLANVTLSGNSTDTSGGGIRNNGGGSVQLENTLVANTPSGGNCSGTITSLGNNLDSGTTCGFNQPGDLSNTSPLLGPLQLNGGPTQTHALLSGSPAIDAGDNVSCMIFGDFDQRGFPRPRDGNGDSIAICDIGAFEFGVAATFTVTNFFDTGAFGQLRSLINNALDGDTIVIPAVTITLMGGSLDITQSLTLQGAGADLTIIDGGGIDRVIETSGVGAVIISGVTIRNGNAGTQGPSGEVITSNVSPVGVGGGISHNSLGPLIVINTAVLGNVASEGGAGIAIGVGSGPVTLTNVTLSGNNAQGFGGGISTASAGPVTLTNVTISGNSGGVNGGGITSTSTGPVTLTNVTLSGNSANNDGGIFTLGGIVQLKNTIVANSLVGGNCRVGGAILSLGHNLDSGTTCGFNQPGDLSNANPLLGPLQLNGGPTRTHALLSGSPAIDAGDNVGCPDTDQRGVPRPQDGNGDGPAICDIGAVEVSASVSHTLTITSLPSGTPNPVPSSGTANLSVTAQDSLGHPLTYAWTADCPAALVGDGSFNDAALQTPTWTAPPNTTGSQQNCTIQVVVSDGQGQTQSPSYPQGVSTEGAHTLTITSLPSGAPNPVPSSGTANLSVAAQDSLGHTLTYTWTADCPPALVGDGSFNDPTLQTPTWTAPPNTTGSQQDCTIQVVVNDGQLSPVPGQYAQGVSPEGMGPSEPPVPQLLNVMTLSGPGGAEQQTFLPTDPITAEVTYFDPNPACAGVAPVLLQLLAFNQEGQLILTREDVTSAPIAPGSKYRLLSANLNPGDLAPGAYTLIFLVRDCTSVNIFVSGAYAIRVLP